MRARRCAPGGSSGVAELGRALTKVQRGKHVALSPIACRAVTGTLGDLPTASGPWATALSAGVYGSGENGAAVRRYAPHAVVGHALDALVQPVWLLREDATVDYANAAALALAKRQACIKMQGRVLWQLGVIDGEALRQAVQRLAGGKSPSMITAFRVAGHLQRVTLNLTSIAANPSYVAAWPLATALMVLDPPHASDLSDPWLRLFARLHGLTRAELRVLTLLLQGKSVPEVAEGLGVAYSTARSHVRVLLEKTGSQRQSDLIRRVLG